MSLRSSGLPPCDVKVLNPSGLHHLHLVDVHAASCQSCSPVIVQQNLWQPCDYYLLEIFLQDGSCVSCSILMSLSRWALVLFAPGSDGKHRIQVKFNKQKPKFMTQRRWLRQKHRKMGGPSKVERDDIMRNISELKGFMPLPPLVGPTSATIFGLLALEAVKNCNAKVSLTTKAFCQ